MGFESFLGNEAAVSTIKGMLRQRAVPGSLLFSGPDGTGKKTLAAMLARALNCERLSDDFCGECGSCIKSGEMLDLARADLSRRREMKDASRRVEGLVYFDVQLIEPLGRFILIEQIRALRRTAYTHPFELRQRVFILDEAQAIHWQAVDLLLKVMEEPPPTTTLILVCPNPNELRPTVRSRCRRVSFFPAGDSVIREILATERKIPQAQLDLAVRVSRGSIAAAKSFDLTAYQDRRKPWVDFLNGVTSGNVQSMRAADWKALFDSTKALSEHRADLESTLHVGYSLISDILQELEKRERIVNIDLEPRIKKWAAKLGLEAVERLNHGLDSAYRLQVRNVNQQLGWDALATELVNPDFSGRARF
ncbi:MAG: ATP-binding protein [Terriglobia bacterium]